MILNHKIHKNLNILENSQNIKIVPKKNFYFLFNRRKVKADFPEIGHSFTKKATQQV
jgi:hypothetical protein